MINILFLYYLSVAPVLTLKDFGSSAAQHKCCYRLFLNLYKYQHALTDYTKHHRTKLTGLTRGHCG